jgi:hypothetical protein
MPRGPHWTGDCCPLFNLAIEKLALTQSRRR